MASALGQQAPAPFRVETYKGPEAPVEFFSAEWSRGPTPLSSEVFKGEQISMESISARPYIMEEIVGDPDGSWIVVRFAGFNLGSESLITITSQGDTEQRQLFDQKKLTLWAGRSSIFNGGTVKISLSVYPEDEGVFYQIQDVLIGEHVEKAKIEDGPGDQQEAVPGKEAICGFDDRTPSHDNRLGRIMPIGCTGWAIGNGAFLTAGHCVTDDRTHVLQFEVPRSSPDGTPRHPSIEKQFRILRQSIEFENRGVGRDWAVFSVLPNDAGKSPADIYGTFRIKKDPRNAELTVRGYGLDDDPAGPPPNLRNNDSQTQQEHFGPLISLETPSANKAFIKHRVDTRGGNSGSPIFFANGPGEAIGIHTHGGCNSKDRSANRGTSFKHRTLWEAISRKGPLE